MQAIFFSFYYADMFYPMLLITAHCNSNTAHPPKKGRVSRRVCGREMIREAHFASRLVRQSFSEDGRDSKKNRPVRRRCGGVGRSAV